MREAKGSWLFWIKRSGTGVMGTSHSNFKHVLCPCLTLDINLHPHYSNEVLIIAIKQLLFTHWIKRQWDPGEKWPWVSHHLFNLFSAHQHTSSMFKAPEHAAASGCLHLLFLLQGSPFTLVSTWLSDFLQLSPYTFTYQKSFLCQA